MSEEAQNTEQIENKEEAIKSEQTCKFNVLVILVVLSLLFSITSLTLSIINSKGGMEKQVVVSKQYDKGQSLDKALETKKPIIAFFYADWCGFCQRFAPTFHKIARDSKIKSKFAIAYINCDAPENSKHVQEYGIQAFPTVFVIKTDGSRVQLDNNTFFNDDSKIVVRDKALEIIGENK